MNRNKNRKARPVGGYGAELAPDLPAASGRYAREDYTAPHAEEAYIISIDAKGELGWTGSTITRPGQPAPEMATGLIAEQVLDSADGEIHYSYNLPERYNPSGSYPLVVVMPGYDRMLFGESSSGRNLDWRGFQVWIELEEDLIVVSVQLTDWGETSARQAMALTEYFLENFAVDASRVYAAGYSAGGETMSRAVSMRPDLYAAYLHGASQWDGDYAPVAEAG